MSVRERIDGLVGQNHVVLFMKGTRFSPRCGFSASVVGVLDELLPDYLTVDVLSDAELREGIKEYSSWPTIPQLYVKGEFVGGADIVREMLESGELHEVLGVSAASAPEPTITLGESARAALLRFHEGEGAPVVRLQISPRFEYGMDFDDARPGDVTLELGGVTLLLDRASARRAEGLVVDFVETPEGGGFKIDSPLAPPKVRELSAVAVRERFEAGAIRELIDVRTEEEREIGFIEGSSFLDEETGARLESLPKDTPLAFYCHHGRRSQQAAEHFLRLGFTEVYNLTGGIDAWSREVDPEVPRY